MCVGVCRGGKTPPPGYVTPTPTNTLLLLLLLRLLPLLEAGLLGPPDHDRVHVRTDDELATHGVDFIYL